MTGRHDYDETVQACAECGTSQLNKNGPRPWCNECKEAVDVIRRPCIGQGKKGPKRGLARKLAEMDADDLVIE